MTITLPLPPAQEERLLKKALAHGRDPEDYVADLVLRDIQAESDMMPHGKSLAEMPLAGESLAEYLEGYIGVVDSSKNNGGQISHTAENASEEFTNYLIEKQKAGHL